MKTFGWFMVTIFIFVGLFLSLRFLFCRPNYFVVKTAKPVAEKIADYIVKNGIPERLDKIPDLPYKLTNCKRVENYWKEHKQVKNKDIAETIEIFMSCTFDHRTKILSKYEVYDVTLKYNNSFKQIDIDIINNSANTGIGYELKENNNSKYKITFFSNGYTLKSNGVCRSFKQ